MHTPLPHAARSHFAVLTGLTIGEIYELLGDFPSRALNEGGRAITFQVTGANVDFLEKRLGKQHIDWSQCPEALGIKELEQRATLRTQAKAEWLTDSTLSNSSYIYHTKPFEHQRLAFELSRDAHAFGYLMEMGCGKTKVQIDDIADLYERGLIDLAIILAPNGVHVQWVNEQIPAHLPPRIVHRAAYYRSNSNKPIRDRLTEAIYFKDGLRIITMNIEAMSHHSGEDFVTKLIKTSKVGCLLAIDESSRVKVPGTRRTKTIGRLGRLPQVKYRRILSGSPVTRGAEDLYSQVGFLDDRILGFSSFTTFKQRYCLLAAKDIGYGQSYQKIVGYRHLDELQRKLDGWTYRVTKEDCLDLPPKIYVKRYVELVPEQKKLYEQLRDKLLAEIDDHTLVEAPIAIVKMLRLQQVLSGYLTRDENPDEIAWQLPVSLNPRLNMVKELYDEAQGSVLIWARFRQDIRMLEELLRKDGAVTYFGETSPEKREAAIAKLKSHPKIPFIGNPAAAGIGLNLIEASTSIYYSNSFSAEQRWQSEDRNHRIGQKNSVTYYDILVKNTIDIRLQQVLRERRSIAAETIDGIRAFLETPIEGVEV